MNIPAASPFLPPLFAIRFPLEPGPPVDPFALAGDTGILFHSESRVLVGTGPLWTIALPGGLGSSVDVRRAGASLASVECEDLVVGGESGVIGFGAHPFDSSAPAALLLPAITYGKEAGGREWITVVADDRASLPSSLDQQRQLLHRLIEQGKDALAPGGTSVASNIEPLTSDDHFRNMVARSVEAIHRHELVKVVLARHVDVSMIDPIVVSELLARWGRLEPNCAVFSMPTSNGQFVGASPELLIHRAGPDIRCRPLAGTTERFAGTSSGTLPSELLESTKDSVEHQLVVDAIKAELDPICSTLTVPSHPDLVHLHNITHLGTPISGRLNTTGDGTVPTSLELAAALHPTPAVGGVPAEAARRMIADLEPRSRGTYAGPVGYVDARGDGTWMVGIRAMTVRDRSARLSAGVGIVDGSQPDTELAEANLKFTAVFDALAPGQLFSTTKGTEPQAAAV
jgi:menaquinone-specific isochorismate synthase